MLRKATKMFRTRRADQVGASFLALDVGTQWVKAVVAAGDSPQVLGVGRSRQHLGDMDGGAVAHIEGVVATVRRALREATTLAGTSPRFCLAGIAGELVEGIVVTVARERRRPERPVSLEEVERLAAETVPEAARQAKERVSRRTGIQSPHVVLVDTALVDVIVDGYRVTNPVDFKGRHLQIAVFHTFSPLVHVRALETVIERVGCEVLGLVAEPYAVAAAALPPDAYETGAVVVDIGGGSTDVAAVERRGLTGTKMVAMGGQAFTRSLAEALGVDMEAAEEYKLDYAAGTLEGDLAAKVRAVVLDDLEVLRDALRFAFADLKGAGALPARVYLCGGGSSLPGVAELLRDPSWVQLGFFARTPVVFTLKPEAVTGVIDPQMFLQGARDVTPKALAAQAYKALYGRRGMWSICGALAGKEC